VTDSHPPIDPARVALLAAATWSEDADDWPRGGSIAGRPLTEAEEEMLLSASVADLEASEALQTAEVERLVEQGTAKRALLEIVANYLSPHDRDTLGNALARMPTAVRATAERLLELGYPSDHVNRP